MQNSAFMAVFQGKRSLNYDIKHFGLLQWQHIKFSFLDQLLNTSAIDVLDPQVQSLFVILVCVLKADNIRVSKHLQYLGLRDLTLDHFSIIKGLLVQVDALNNPFFIALLSLYEEYGTEGAFTQ